MSTRALEQHGAADTLCPDVAARLLLVITRKRQ